METCLWENPVIDTGPVKEGTPVFNVAPLCWFLTKTVSAASPHPPRIVMFPRLPRLLKKKSPKEAISMAEAAGVVPSRGRGTLARKTEDAFRPWTLGQGNNHLHPKDCHLTSLAAPRFCNVLTNRNVNIFCTKVN